MLTNSNDDTIKEIYNAIYNLSNRIGVLESQFDRLYTVIPNLRVTQDSYGKLADLILSIGAKYHRYNDDLIPFQHLYDKVKDSALYSGKNIKKSTIVYRIHRSLDILVSKGVIASTSKGWDRAITICLEKRF